MDEKEIHDKTSALEANINFITNSLVRIEKRLDNLQCSARGESMAVIKNEVEGLKSGVKWVTAIVGAVIVSVITGFLKLFYGGK